MPERKGHSIAPVLILLLIAALLSACSLNALPPAASTSAAEVRTSVPALPTATATPRPSQTPAPATATRSAPVVVLPPTVVNCTVRAEWYPYSVAPGDTLTRIAARGNTTVDVLATGNCLSDPSRIERGQTLYVPYPIALPPAPDEPVRYYLILAGDNGVNASPVGCEDSITLVNSGILRTGVVTEDVSAALTALFNAQPAAEGQAYTNSLYGQGLSVGSINLNGARLNIAIYGSLALSGVCEDARMRAQLLQTIFQYGGFEDAFVTVGGQNVKQLFDASGTVGPDAVITRLDPIF